MLSGFLHHKGFLSWWTKRQQIRTKFSGCYLRLDFLLFVSITIKFIFSWLGNLFFILFRFLLIWHSFFKWNLMPYFFLDCKWLHPLGQLWFFWVWTYFSQMKFALTYFSPSFTDCFEVWLSFAVFFNCLVEWRCATWAITGSFGCRATWTRLRTWRDSTCPSTDCASYRARWNGSSRSSASTSTRTSWNRSIAISVESLRTSYRVILCDLIPSIN